MSMDKVNGSQPSVGIHRSQAQENPTGTQGIPKIGTVIGQQSGQQPEVPNRTMSDRVIGFLKQAAGLGGKAIGTTILFLTFPLSVPFGMIGAELGRSLGAKHARKQDNPSEESIAAAKLHGEKIGASIGTFGSLFLIMGGESLYKSGKNYSSTKPSAPAVEKNPVENYKQRLENDQKSLIRSESELVELQHLHKSTQEAVELEKGKPFSPKGRTESLEKSVNAYKTQIEEKEGEIASLKSSIENSQDAIATSERNPELFKLKEQLKDAEYDYLANKVKWNRDLDNHSRTENKKLFAKNLQPLLDKRDALRAEVAQLEHSDKLREQETNVLREENTNAINELLPQINLEPESTTASSSTQPKAKADAARDEFEKL